MIIIDTKHTTECTKLHYILKKFSMEHAPEAPPPYIVIPQRDVFQQIKYQIKIIISINNDVNHRYSTYKGNIVIYIIIHLHTFKYIYTHTYY